MLRVVILIPARYGSIRFPGKPLAKIAGKTMIERVYANCADSGFETAVVTDNEEIEKAVKNFKGKVLRVDDDVPSGSERIALAYDRFYSNENYELIINVQGDEPLLKGESLKELAYFHQNTDFDITTLLRERSSQDEEFQNPNVVKAIWSNISKQCLYFSRQSIPYERDGNKEHRWHQHIGVYSYKPEALAKMVRLPPSYLEDLEKLEQLRGMENGLSIGALLSDQQLIGVDVPADIKKVEEVIG